MAKISWSSEKKCSLLTRREFFRPDFKVENVFEKFETKLEPAVHGMGAPKGGEIEQYNYLVSWSVRCLSTILTIDFQITNSQVTIQGFRPPNLSYSLVSPYINIYGE